MGFDIASAGYQTGTGLLGAGLGIIMQKANDKRQLKQQQKLQALQIGGQKEMTDYNMAKQLEMWKNTSYPAQMEMLKEAGLNPGLMYGMGGGGGQTTGSASGNVTGGVAPSGGGEIGMGIDKVMQLSLLKAQKENIEANTNKTEQETANIGEGGIDTRTKETQIADLTQGIENKKAQEVFQKIQNDIATIEKEIVGRTKEDAITTIQQGALKAIDEARMALYQANADEQTWETKIKQVQAEYVGMQLRNELTGSQIVKTETEIKAIAEQLVQGWHKLNIDFGNANTGRARFLLDQYINDVKNSTKLTWETVKGIVQGILIGRR